MKAKAVPPSQPKVWTKVIMIVAVILLILGVGVSIYAGDFFFHLVLTREGRESIFKNIDVSDYDQDKGGFSIEEFKKELGEATDWAQEHQTDTWQIISEDGLKLSGRVFLQPDRRRSAGWVIAVHGYANDSKDMYLQAQNFYGQGYNVLLPDCRAHGDSEGVYVGMGWLDRRDTVRWAYKIADFQPDAEIVLYGISMGAATVMMASGEQDLPVNVKCIVEDCGYSSVWEQLSAELKTLLGMPPFPVLYTSDIISYFSAGYSFRQASSVEQIKKAKIPIMFIHGEADEFVPGDMVYQVYDAAAVEKELLVVPNTGHTRCCACDKEYWNKIKAFTQKHVNAFNQ